MKVANCIFVKKFFKFLSMILCVTVLFGIFGDSFGYGADTSTDVTTISDSYFTDGIPSKQKFSFDANTFSGYEFTGVDGVLLEGSDDDGAPAKGICVPIGNRNGGFSYTDFLDVYYENIGTIGGRSINAQVHFNSMTVEAPYDSTPENTSNLLCVTYLSESFTYMSVMVGAFPADYLGVETGWRAASIYDVTVTLKYADTNEIVDTPMTLCASDIDAGTPDTYTEGWEGIAGFSGNLYVYQSNINRISGLKVMSGYITVDGDESWLKTGVYAPTVTGQFQCRFYEGDCATTLQIYYPEDDIVVCKETDGSDSYAVGDTVSYSITHEKLEFYRDTFNCYENLSFYDKLPEEIDYVEGSAKLYDDGIDVTDTYGSVSYDSSTGILTYTVSKSVLKDISFYDRGTIRLTFDAVVNENASPDLNKDGVVMNTAIVNISGVDYECECTITMDGIGYIKKVDSKTGGIVAGAVYYVYMDEGCTILAEDVYGEKSYFTTTDEAPYSNGICYEAGRYYVKEYSTPKGYVSDDTVYILEIEEGSTSYVNAGLVYENPVMGTVTVEKTDADTHDPLPGATYNVAAGEDIIAPDGTVRAVKDEVVDVVITGEDGAAVSSELFPGKYYLQEISQPAGYILDTEKHDFELTYEDQHTAVVNTTVDLTNTGNELVITKYKSGTSTILPGISFYMWNSEDASESQFDPEAGYVDMFTTDGNGQIVLRYLTPGVYYLKECETLPGYVCDDQVYTITVDQDGYINKKEKFELDIQNDFTKLYVAKRDMASGIELPGAVLQIQDPDGNVCYEWISGDQPYYIEEIPAGEYVLVEKTAPDHYLKTENIEFTVKDTGEIQSVGMSDDYTKLVVSKKDITNGTELPGAVLQIRDPGRNVLFEWISENEPHLIEGLDPGDYILVEKAAPEGYATAENVRFSVDETGDFQTVEMMDDVTKVKISKLDIISEERLPGAVLQIIDKTGKVLDEWVSDADPHYIENLPVGDYILREKVSPEKYSLSEDVAFSVRDTSEIQSVVIMDQRLIGTIRVSVNMNGTDTVSGKFGVSGAKTGDYNHLLWYMISAIAAISGISGYFFLKKRKNVGDRKSGLKKNESN